MGNWSFLPTRILFWAFSLVVLGLALVVSSLGTSYAGGGMSGDGDGNNGGPGTTQSSACGERYPTVSGWITNKIDGSDNRNLANIPGFRANESNTQADFDRNTYKCANTGNLQTSLGAVGSGALACQTAGNNEGLVGLWWLSTGSGAGAGGGGKSYPGQWFIWPAPQISASSKSSFTSVINASVAQGRSYSNVGGGATKQRRYYGIIGSTAKGVLSNHNNVIACVWPSLISQTCAGKDPDDPLPDPITHGAASDDDETGTVFQEGYNINTDLGVEAMDWNTRAIHEACYLKCPTSGQLNNTNDPTRVLRQTLNSERAGEWIPKGGGRNRSDERGDTARGAWCFNRDDYQTRMVYRPVDTDRPTAASDADFYWYTNASGEDTPEKVLNMKDHQWEVAQNGVEITPLGELLSSCLRTLKDDWSPADPSRGDPLCWPTDAEINAKKIENDRTDKQTWDGDPDGDGPLVRDGVPSLNMTLSNEAKKFMAEGGVMTVSDQTANYQFTLTDRQWQTCNDRRGRSWEYTLSKKPISNGRGTWPSANAGSWGNWGGCAGSNNASNFAPNGNWYYEDLVNYDNVSSAPTRTPSSWTNVGDQFLQNIDRSLDTISNRRVDRVFQAVANHCNQPGYAQAVNNAGFQDTWADGDDHGQVKNGDAGKWYSGSMVSETYDGEAVLMADETLPFGRPVADSNDPTAMASFYDSICYVNGVASNARTGEQVNPDANDGKTSVPANYTFFRDNRSYVVEHNGTGKANETTVTGASPYFTPHIVSDSETTRVTVQEGWKVQRSGANPGPKPVAPTAPVVVPHPGTDNTWVTIRQQVTWKSCTGATYKDRPISAVDFGTTNAEMNTEKKSTVNPPSHYAYATSNPSWTCSSTGDGSGNRNITVPPNTTIKWTVWVNGRGEFHKVRGRGSFTSPHSPAWTTAYNLYQDYLTARAKYNADLAQYNSDLAAWQAANAAAGEYTDFGVQDNCPADNSTYTYLCEPNLVEKTITGEDSSGVGVIDYRPGQRPTATILTRDPDSTPDVSQRDIYVHNAVTNQKARAFGNDPANIDRPDRPTQFTATEGYQEQGATVAVVPGDYNQVATNSTWSSTNRRPEVLTMAWYYDLDISNKFPTTVSFPALKRTNGNKILESRWTATEESVPVLARVDAVNDTSLVDLNSQDFTNMRIRQWQHSGTPDQLNGMEDDWTNYIDIPLYYGDRKNDTSEWAGNPSNYNRHYFTIDYVRAVSE